MQSQWAIGLMTGTVLDGMIDVAMIRTDGEDVHDFGPYALYPYSQTVRATLSKTVEAALKWRFDGPEPAIFSDAEAALTDAQSDAVGQLLADNDLSASDVAVIGFHGQTVMHVAPQKGRRGQTRQLGNGQQMADRLGIDVVYDFRSADVAAGGQGAPLSAIYHQALLRRIGAGPETAILNLGGVGNITWCDGDQMIAFDTGPANGPLNDWIRSHEAGDFDEDGRIAATGTVDEARLSALLDHSYFTTAYPKSLDRYDFLATMADGLQLADGAATLTAFTAGAVGKALDLLPSRPTRLIVCGGGRKNPVIMRELARRTRAKPILADEVGLRGDALEAECFAYLAVRALLGLPISYPMTTGVTAPMTGGIVAAAGHAASNDA